MISVRDTMVEGGIEYVDSILDIHIMVLKSKRSGQLQARLETEQKIKAAVKAPGG